MAHKQSCESQAERNFSYEAYPQNSRQQMPSARSLHRMVFLYHREPAEEILMRGNVEAAQNKTDMHLVLIS